MNVTPRRLCFIALAVSTAIATVACTGGSDEPALRETAPSSGPILTDPRAALDASVERLAQDLSSGRAEFSWEISREGFQIEGGGNYAFQSPDRLHLDADYSGQGEIPSAFHEENESELLALGQLVYLKTPLLGEGWLVFSSEEFGADWAAIQRLLAAKSPLDYRAVVNAVEGEVEHAGSEDVDGQSSEHYRAVVDAGSVMNALADAYGSQGQVILANRFSGPVDVDIWVDAATQLPRRLEANGTFDFMGAPADMTLSVTLTDHNQDPRLPDAPEDAQPPPDLTR